MAGTNSFLPFATGGSANVITDATYASLAALSTGFQSGVAQSQQLNKVWRQSSVIAAAIGQIIANYGNNATDSDGTTTLAANIRAALMGSLQSLRSISAATTLTFTDFGKVINATGTTAFTITLPLANTAVSGGAIWFMNNTTANITIAIQGTDKIFPNSVSVTSMTLYPGDDIALVSDASTGWYDFGGGTAALPYAGIMSQAVFSTAAQFNNSTRLATTAFVQNALGSKSGVTTISAATTLIASQAGETIVCGGSTNYTVTLPVSTACAAGVAIVLHNVGSGTLTISRQSTDVIYPNATSVTSLTLGPGDTAELMTNATTGWYLIDGSITAPYAAVMAGANFTTPAQFDNTTKIATTAFVQRALGNYANFLAYGTSQTLTAAQVGSLVQGNNAAGMTLTLPLISAVADGSRFSFINVSTGALTISRQGTDVIYSPTLASLTTQVLNQGDTLTVAKVGTGWYMIDGTVALNYQSTIGVCRAWVNFDGTLTTPISPRAAYNVSSVTKNSTGDYTLNFTNALTDANYSIVFGTNGRGSTNTAVGMAVAASAANGTLTLMSNSAVRVITGTTEVGGLQDKTLCSVSIFR